MSAYEGFLDSDFFHERSRIGLDLKMRSIFYILIQRITAKPHGEGRSNGSSKLLPYHRFVRKVIAVAYGRRRWNGTHTWVRPYSGFVREVIAVAYGGKH